MITPRRSDPTPEEIEAWRSQRAAIGRSVQELIDRGICYQCHDQHTGGGVLGEQSVIADHDDVRAVLALDPRVAGHTIVVWKAHVHDFTGLDDAETARLFTFARDIARAIRSAIDGVERVYQVTMCDGPVNHLHLQLIPRYTGTEIGSRRLVDPRGPLRDGPELARAIREAYLTAES